MREIARVWQVCGANPAEGVSSDKRGGPEKHALTCAAARERATGIEPV